MAQKQDLRLLLDIPEPQALFHFDDYAKVIATAIVNSEPQFTIGIFGPWGKGKTTLLSKVEEELNRQGQDIVVVPFDAWRYQHESHMLLPILETLEQAIQETAGAFQGLRAQIGKLAKAFAYSTTLSAGFASVSLKEGLNKLEEETKSCYYNWLQELSDAMTAVRRRSSEARVVFLIDDLDRCLPGKAIEVLEAMKVMLDVEGFVFVVALDEAVIEKVIEIHYGTKYGINGRDYVKKLVQMEFTLPGLRPQDVQEYVKVLLGKLSGLEENMVSAVAEVVPMIAEDNPREVKRFINSTLIANAISVRAGVTVPPEAQVCFIGLKFRWPEFARQLCEQISLVAGVNRYFVGDVGENPEGRDAVKAILDSYPGLERFLEMDVSRKFLQLSSTDLEQLIFYGGVVEKTTIERTVERFPSRTPTSEVFMRFNEETRQVLLRAHDEALRRGHRYIDTEHILLGVVAENSGIASEVLNSLGVYPDKVRAAIHFVIGKEVKRAGKKREVILAPRAKRAIELAVEEAQRLASSYVGGDHLLLGLLREREGLAFHILDSFRVTEEALREALLNPKSRRPSI